LDFNLQITLGSVDFTFTMQGKSDVTGALIWNIHPR